MNYRHRHATPQAWRKLRETLTEVELADIAHDICGVIYRGTDCPRSLWWYVYFALVEVNWDSVPQVNSNR